MGKRNRLEDEVGKALEADFFSALQRLDHTSQVILTLHYRQINQRLIGEIATELDLRSSEVSRIRKSAVLSLRRGLAEARNFRRDRGLSIRPSLTLAECLQILSENMDSVPEREDLLGDASEDEDVLRCRNEMARKGIEPEPNRYNKDGTPNRSFATYLWCPKCGNEVVILGRIRGGGDYTGQSRKARCPECDHRWWTRSREAFGGTRQVEVRG